MKTKKLAFIIMMIITGSILFTVQSAIGGCEILALEPYVDKKAPGTRYQGTLTLYFDNVDSYIFARIENKKVPYAFAGKIDGIGNPQELLNNPTVVEAFFTENVVPYLYNCDPGFPECNPPDADNCAACPEAAFKAYSDDVNWENPGCYDNRVWEAAPLFFYILDFAIAVDD